MYASITFYQSLVRYSSLYHLYCRLVISKESSLETRGGCLVGVQVSPTSERRVHYCPALNLFVVYRRRAAKWYPILWYPYVVYRTSVRRGGGDPLANATHVVTSCRPLSSRRNPSALLVGTISVGERWAQRASWGALIAYHLTLSGQDLSLTACGLRHPAVGVATCKRIIFNILPVRCTFCGLMTSRIKLPEMNITCARITRMCVEICRKKKIRIINIF